MIENAIRIPDKKRLTQANVDNFSRIYFGNETCPKKFPSVKDIDFFLNFIYKHNKKGTILTPFIPDYYFKHIMEGVEFLPHNFEIVINDLGLFHKIRHAGFMLIMGRQLLPIRRDVRISLPEDLKILSSYNPDFFEYFSEMGFIRFEIDNIQYPFFVSNHKQIPYRFSIYYPEIITNIHGADCMRCNESFNCEFKSVVKKKNVLKGNTIEFSWHELLASNNYVYYENRILNKNNLKYSDRIVFTGLIY